MDHYEWSLTWKLMDQSVLYWPFCVAQTLTTVWYWIVNFPYFSYFLAYDLTEFMWFRAFWRNPKGAFLIKSTQMTPNGSRFFAWKKDNTTHLGPSAFRERRSFPWPLVDLYGACLSYIKALLKKKESKSFLSNIYPCFDVWLSVVFTAQSISFSDILRTTPSGTQMHCWLWDIVLTILWVQR